ncbi:hypothetical protein ASF88_04290 [Leifsonia sp. Leaf336]|uniref:CU044_2847 family protein n=1 Tax=Leifsonia sp. Leaf336 TaxID=1736341 RepID=UPI0006F34FF2|nr:CU044_2847 family protein [Leifsonia sp. Leaf336]KQR54061.1 hypothetical protein ASF88_04290 [Leifsonia sp. Leaf336]
MADRIIAVDIGDDVKIAVAAEQRGPQLVADKDITARLSSVTDSIEVVAKAALDAVKKALPDKATVELSFGLAIEEGKLLALLGKGKAEASITVTLEWSRTEVA